MSNETIGLLFGILATLFTLSWLGVQLARIERKLNALLWHLGVGPQRPPLSDRVKQLASDSAGKIEAIKAYREETGVGLAEAKEAVEAFMSTR